MTKGEPTKSRDDINQIDAASFQRIAAIMHSDSGIVLSEGKKNLIISRLARRLRELKIAGFSEYCQFLEEHGGAEERRHLVSLLTTNVTQFFRERHHFDTLDDKVLPPLIARAKAGGRVRIWSAGCSTGQEPYSIAMSILDLCSDAARYDIRILGTDIDQKVIHAAQAAEYPNIDDAHLPTALRNRFFDLVEPGTDRFRLKPEPRQLVTFAELNLLQDWPMKGPFDIIFCRNVVIYFDSTTQARLWSRFTDVLTHGGHLFLGHSERVNTSVERRLVPVGVTQYQRLSQGSDQPSHRKGRDTHEFEGQTASPGR